MSLLGWQKVIGLKQKEIVGKGIEKPQDQGKKPISWSEAFEKSKLPLHRNHDQQHTHRHQGGEKQLLRHLEKLQGDLESRSDCGADENRGQSKEGGFGLLLHALS